MASQFDSFTMLCKVPKLSVTNCWRQLSPPSFFTRDQAVPLTFGLNASYMIPIVYRYIDSYSAGP